jgi:hypothetical protein
MSVLFYLKIVYEKLKTFVLRLRIPQILDIPQWPVIELKQKKTNASFYGTTAITVLKVAYC